MTTINDFFAGSDENDRSELDAAIAAEEARRLRVEAAERSQAKTVYDFYKSGAIKKLNKQQEKLLIKFGYARVTEETETKYGVFEIL